MAFIIDTLERPIATLSFWIHAAILSLLWLVVDQYEILDNLRLSDLMPVVLFGFFASNMVPDRWRIHVLNFTFLGSVFYLFGWEPGAYLVSLLGLFFLVIFNPLHFRLKVFLVLLFGAALLFCWRQIELPIALRSILPIFGTLVMFRTIIFLFDQSYGLKYSLKDNISYFLLLPNLLFPVFPIIDYKVFNKSQRGDRQLAHKRGLQLIFRGITHLLIFRVIYHYWTPSPKEIDGALTVFQYLVTSYLGVVKLSGMFHITIGVLCLFGFNLPDVFHNYFLADGFSDLWKRINIYWRDFILKVFYYPIYLRIKSRHFTLTLVVTVLIAFVVNWFMHSYQWLWILGSFPITKIDLIFWGSFGVLVAGSAFYQRTQSVKKTISGGQPISSTLYRSGRIMAVFMTMSILWVLWQVPSLNVFLKLFNTAAQTMGNEGLQLILILISIYILLVIGLRIGSTDNRLRRVLTSSKFITMSNLILFGLILLFQLGPVRMAVTKTFDVDVQFLASQRANSRDDMKQFDGYYENLTAGISDMISESAILDSKRWKPVKFIRQIKTGIPMVKTMEPNISVTFYGAKYETNSWGFRDKEYSLEKSENVHRVALVGSSEEVGRGVENNEVFEQIVELELNKELADSIEIINFSIQGSAILQSIYRAEYVIEKFKPDALLFFLHETEGIRMNQRFAFMMKNKEQFSPGLDSLFNTYGINKSDTRQANMKVLNRHTEKTMSYAIQELKNLVKFEIPVSIVFAARAQKKKTSEILRYDQLLKDNGLYTTSIMDVYDDYSYEELIISKSDFHGNAKAHKLIADELVRRIKEDKKILGIQ